ncbi:hypothetical protein FKB36_04900 [Methanoculleus sp. Afa-1]|uniref:Type I restriction modification DNA specificity domain-containing protein n=1 Tax=Methanoculleus formosensis TaxID=2590886 RepID=A0A9E4ZN50_9EURY|nr:hypothetical protein [Methanoculleus sp. Afa-1]MCT8336846.1 hypothetical protein [Methanoculleus sp. Afa-1]
MHSTNMDSKARCGAVVVPLKFLLETKITGLSSYYLKPDKGDPTVDIPLVNMGDIVDGVINTGTVKRATVRRTGKLESDTILPGDVILTLRAQPFRAAIAGPDVAGAALSANLVGLRCSDLIKPEILAAWFNSSAGQRILVPRAGISTLVGISLKELLQVEVPVPPREQQDLLSRYLALATEHTRILKEEQKLLDSIVDSIINSL